MFPCKQNGKLIFPTQYSVYFGLYHKIRYSSGQHMENLQKTIIHSTEQDTHETNCVKWHTVA